MKRNSLAVLTDIGAYFRRLSIPLDSLVVFLAYPAYGELSMQKLSSYYETSK